MDKLDCRIIRRFGVEIELNTTNGVIIRQDESKGETPMGSDYVAYLIRKCVKEKVYIKGWDHIHNNMAWIVKPDSSCGIEVNTPVLKGWLGLKKLLKVIDAFGDSPKVVADRKCSLHVHVSVEDLSEEQIGSVIAYYIKCEHVLFDAMPHHRKVNRYCQLIGMSDLFWHDFPIEPAILISRISDVKYYSLNTYHMMKGGGVITDNDRRKTIEFRIAENDVCLDPYLAKNWIRFVLHFVEMTKDMPLPQPYEKDNPWSGLLWLDAKDVYYDVLRFGEELSPGLQQVKSWFVNRLMENMESDMGGIWSMEGRKKSIEQLPLLVSDVMLDEYFNEVDLHEATYSDKYSI